MYKNELFVIFSARHYHLQIYLIIRMLCNLFHRFFFWLSALSGILFPGKEEAAFSNFRLWESTGSVITYAYSPYLCTETKLYVLIGILCVGMVGYGLIEWFGKADRAVPDTKTDFQLVTDAEANDTTKLWRYLLEYFSKISSVKLKYLSDLLRSSWLKTKARSKDKNKKCQEPWTELRNFFQDSVFAFMDLTVVLENTVCMLLFREEYSTE